MQKLIIPEIPQSLEVRNSGIHNKGLFAKEDIERETEIIRYGGELISKDEAEKRIEAKYDEAEENPSIKGENYVFELEGEYDLDGDFDWNVGKFANHSCEANTEFANIDGEIWIVATKDIKKGDEITINYGYSFDSYEDFPCKCGSKNCVGYIVAEEHFDKVREDLKKKNSFN